MLWFRRFEKAHEEVRSPSRRKIQENMLKNVLTSPPVHSVDTPIAKVQMARKERKEFPDDALMGTLQEVGPLELRAHLFFNPQKCTSYAVVRSEAMSFMEAKVGARPYKD